MQRSDDVKSRRGLVQLTAFACVWMNLICWTGLIDPNYAQAVEIGEEVSLDESYLVEELKKLHQVGVPGVVFAWQEGEQLPVFHLSGLANVDRKMEIQREHVVRAGGVLKMAMGTLVLMLADEGKLSLDDPVAQYVSGVPEGDRITIRMLGNHTSGLFDAFHDTQFRQKLIEQPERVWSHEEVLAVTYANGLANKPGKKFHYSNSNVILLAEIVEKVCGKPWHEMLQHRVFKKLGAMHVKVPAQGWLPRSQKELRGYCHASVESPISHGKTLMDATQYQSSWMGAGGDWVTNVDDLVAMARPLAKGVLLSERMRAEQRSWVKTGTGSMRYGFCLEEWNGGIMGHTGNVPGYATFVGWKEQGDISVVVWTNLSNLKDKTNPAEKLGLKMLGRKL